MQSRLQDVDVKPAGITGSGCASGEVCTDSTATRRGSAPRSVRSPSWPHAYMFTAVAAPRPPRLIKVDADDSNPGRPFQGRGGHRRQFGHRCGHGQNPAAQGYHVVAVARRADRIQRLADEIGGTAVSADITDDDAVNALSARWTGSTCW